MSGWRAVYRRPAARGFLPLLKTVSSDPQTWRDLAWLGVTSTVGFALGLAVVTAVGIVLAYVSMPIWYWAISDPAGQHGLTNLGLFTVDTLGEALAVAAIGLVLAPLALLLARGCATAHAALAARILDPSSPPFTAALAGAAQRDRAGRPLECRPPQDGRPRMVRVRARRVRDRLRGRRRVPEGR